MPEGYTRKRARTTNIGTFSPISDANGRLRYVVLTGGSLVMFKIKKKQGFNQRKKVHSLFGSYCYSGRLAHDELHEQADGDAFGSHPRIYHDGLNVSHVVSVLIRLLTG